MSWRSLSLPNYDVVAAWRTKELEKWLKNNGLEDFVSFVNDTQLDGRGLLELGDTGILFNKNLVDVSVTKRNQLAKCVKECKNQASHAKKQISKSISECKDQVNKQCKKAVNNIKSKKERKSFNLHKSNDHEESDYSENEWNTDFEDSENESEEEPKTPIVEEASTIREVNLTQENRLQSTPKQNVASSKIGYYDMQTPSPDRNSAEIAFSPNSSSVVLKQIKRVPEEPPKESSPKLPPKPQVSPKPSSTIPRPPNTNFHDLKNLTANVSSTLTRPKTQPPAPPSTPLMPFDVPPIPTTIMFEEVGYETPIHPPIIQNGVVRAYPAIAYPSSNSSASDSQDAYEIISNPDEIANGSFDSGFDNHEFARKHSLSDIQLTRLKNHPPFPPPLVAAGTAPLNNSLTPPLPIKSKPLKSTNSINFLQSKIATIKIAGSKNGSSSNTLQNPKPLPPKPNGTIIELPGNDRGFSTLTVYDKSKRPLPGLPKDFLSSPSTLDELNKQPYFYDIERKPAEKLVLGLRQDGAFLVRPSVQGGANNPYTLTLVQMGKPFHLNIRNNKGKYALGREKPNEKMFDTVPAMIKYHRNTPIYVTSQDCRGKECYLKLHP